MTVFLLFDLLKQQMAPAMVEEGVRLAKELADDPSLLEKSARGAGLTQRQSGVLNLVAGAMTGNELGPRPSNGAWGKVLEFRRRENRARAFANTTRESSNPAGGQTLESLIAPKYSLVFKKDCTLFIF